MHRGVYHKSRSGAFNLPTENIPVSMIAIVKMVH